MTYVGIDIGKANLDVAARDVELRAANSPEGFRELMRAVRHLPRPIQFVCEPIGFYGRGLLDYLYSRRCRVSIVGSFRVRQFARAIGRNAKTDKIDARLLAQMGETLCPQTTPQRDPLYVRLSHLSRRRVYLTALIREQELQQEQQTDDYVRRSVAMIIAVTGDERARLDAELERLIASSPRLNVVRQRLFAIPGVGALASVRLIAEFPEIGTVGRKQAAALAGLAPYNYDSGIVTDHCHIRGGRSHLRKSLYMLALVAIRLNPVLRPFYLRLRAAGKPGKVAVIAVMRKLIVYLNQVAKSEGPVGTPGQLTRPHRKILTIGGREPTRGGRWPAKKVTPSLG